MPNYGPGYPNGHNQGSCWTCNGTSVDDCEDNGFFDACMDNEQVCEVEVRRQKGRTYRVAMGCKWRRACEDNKIQNFEGVYGAIDYPRHYSQHQCHNNWWWKTGSVCRQCCDGHARCGMEFIQQNEDYDARYLRNDLTRDEAGPRRMVAWKDNLYNSDRFDRKGRPIGKAVDEPYDE